MNWLWTAIGGLVTIIFLKFLWPFLVSYVVGWATKTVGEHVAKKKDDFLGQMLRSFNSVSAVDSPKTDSVFTVTKEQFEETIETITRKLDLIIKLVDRIENSHSKNDQNKKTAEANIARNVIIGENLGPIENFDPKQLSQLTKNINNNEEVSQNLNSSLTDLVKTIQKNADSKTPTTDNLNSLIADAANNKEVMDKAAGIASTIVNNMEEEDIMDEPVIIQPKSDNKINYPAELAVVGDVLKNSNMVNSVAEAIEKEGGINNQNPMEMMGKLFGNQELMGKLFKSITSPKKS